MNINFRIRTFRHDLIFKRPAGTSRGTMTHRESWFMEVCDPESPEITGLGECAPLPGLSPEYGNAMIAKLEELQNNPENYVKDPGSLEGYPSLRFGLETALLDLRSGGRRILFPSPFTDGKDTIPINGLIWMGDFNYMKQQLREKLAAGFRCIKIKVGAIDFGKELELIRFLRKEHKKEQVEIRLDANGAFQPDEAPEKLKELSDYGIHSIEQPIRQGQWEEMAHLCETSPVPVALDEELIGVYGISNKEKLIRTIRPQYLILKPSLLGGFKACEEWIALAGKYHTGWWATSALESNLGLNAIAQWVYTLKNLLPQGLGTGQLFANNIESPLYIHAGRLGYDPEGKWNVSFLNLNEGGK
ncbi:MAG: o-succinylbenzoate synthase [Bacteroidales bacterium]|nr:o-succinylbenzoate synthase [Bacteroidales bacterium]